MDPVNFGRFWRARRRRSVTGALAFFLGMVGLSTPGMIRQLLDRFSLPWLAVWIAPLVLLVLLARLEPKIIRSEVLRRRIAVGLIIAGLVYVYIVPQLLSDGNGNAPQVSQLPVAAESR